MSEISEDFICKTLGEIFDEPCSFGFTIGGVDYDIALFMADKDGGAWCEVNCPDHDPAVCWKRRHPGTTAQLTA